MSDYSFEEAKILYPFASDEAIVKALSSCKRAGLPIDDPLASLIIELHAATSEVKACGKALLQNDMRQAVREACLTVAPEFGKGVTSGVAKLMENSISTKADLLNDMDQVIVTVERTIHAQIDRTSKMLRRDGLILAFSTVALSAVLSIVVLVSAFGSIFHVQLPPEQATEIMEQQREIIDRLKAMENVK